MKLILKVMLTFDVGDFVNPRSMTALSRILKLLAKYHLRGLFFITGHVAEKLTKLPEVLELLETHEIGYHSSSHTVHPTICEYTDVKEYREAYLTSLKRETAHINPLTGEIEGKGGIELLRHLFPKKKVVCYRAPGLSWSPPHLEALVKLGIQFDFSSCLSQSPVHYNGVTFYPDVISINKLAYLLLLYRVLKNRVIVLHSHPECFVNQDYSDSIYRRGNPKQLSPVKPRDGKKMKYLFWRFEVFLKRISFCKSIGLIEVAPEPTKSDTPLVVSKKVIQKSYERSVAWSKRFFGYEPKYLRNHFSRYFHIEIED